MKQFNSYCNDEATNRKELLKYTYLC